MTVDGVTYPVPEPFQVIATENPIGSVGTQMLPESQLDRFMICVVMGYPSRRDEIEILTGNAGYPSLREMQAVITADDLIRMQAETREVFIHKVIYDYIVSLAEATRNHPMLALGLSPRGSLAAVQMAKAAAYMNGRTFVVPDDVAQCIWRYCQTSCDLKCPGESIPRVGGRRAGGDPGVCEETPAGEESRNERKESEKVRRENQSRIRRGCGA